MVAAFTLSLLLQLAPVLWDDDDRQNIPEPEERRVSTSYDFITGTFAYPLFRAGDVPRHFRGLLGKPKEAENINAVDEVPNSSWYTNRNFLAPMTPEEIARGPNRKSGPSPDGPWLVERCKTSGISPGLHIRDKDGDVFILKFDRAQYPELSTAAEVIGSKIFYAAGYNTPSNSIVSFDPSILELKAGVWCRNSDGDAFHLDSASLEQFFESVARTPDGKIRAASSQFLEGVPKGPFSYLGWRKDDPNDVIAHEHRRELRGLQVIAAFMNHNDIKQLNTLDMYVEENGRKFIKHYLIDFGATLGSATIFPKGSIEGYEHIFDVEQVLKSAVTLGIDQGRRGVDVTPIHPALGYLAGSDFKPEDWKPNIPNPAFANMTDRDGYWGAKIVAAFTEEQLRAAIRAGAYSDPAAEELLLETLRARRDNVARYWFRRVAPLDRFRMAGRTLWFDDLAVQGGYDSPHNVRYEVRCESPQNGGAWILRAGDGVAIPASPDPVRIEITRVSPGWPRRSVSVVVAERNGVLEVAGVRH